jgi:hypothetical protein
LAPFPQISSKAVRAGQAGYERFFIMGLPRGLMVVVI